MLYEDDVVEAVCRYLEGNDYLIRQSLTSVQHGHDIIAEKQGDPTWRLYVEAKGEGRKLQADNGSIRVFIQLRPGVRPRREGRPQGASVASKDATVPPSRAGIALPKNAAHVKEIKLVSRALRNIGIAVFWATKRRAYTSKPRGRSTVRGCKGLRPYVVGNEYARIVRHAAIPPGAAHSRRVRCLGIYALGDVHGLPCSMPRADG